MPTQKQLEADEAVRRLGSVAAAAREIGINASTVRQRLEGLRAQAVRGEIASPPLPAMPPQGFVVARNSAEYDADGTLRRQWVDTRQGNTDGWRIPDGHVVKGESVLLDANANVLAKWIKTREDDAADLVPALQQAFASYVGAAPPIPVPSDTDEHLLTVYPLPDLHFGMFAWGKETGANYDAKIAADMATESVRRLVAQSRPSQRAVLLGLGDYFHANDHKAVTPQSGNRLDVDGRWAKVFASGAHLATRLVSEIAHKHEHVDVVMLPGNHDMDSALTLAVALDLFYARSPHVRVDLNPSLIWYQRFGAVLLGATHGHTMKPERMAMAMAADRAADWGQTQFRHMFFGHIHHETAKEIAGVRVESFQSPAAPDSFNAGHGYRAGRSLNALTFHADRGEIGRHRVNIMGAP